jgi:hypothetical protein
MHGRDSAQVSSQGLSVEEKRRLLSAVPNSGCVSAFDD